MVLKKGGGGVLLTTPTDKSNSFPPDTPDHYNSNLLLWDPRLSVCVHSLFLSDLSLTLQELLAEFAIRQNAIWPKIDQASPAGSALEIRVISSLTFTRLCGKLYDSQENPSGCGVLVSETRNAILCLLYSGVTALTCVSCISTINLYAYKL